MKNLFNFKQNISIGNKSERAFTLIETLVAITILMISIVGPLTIAQKSLVAAITAKDQVIASFLAQELMEKLKNERDAFILDGGSLKDWIIDEGIQEITSCTDTNTNCILYNDTAGKYTNAYGNNNTPSKFSRWVYKTNNTANPEKEIKITVIVSWNNGTASHTVKLENNFYDVTL